MCPIPFPRDQPPTSIVTSRAKDGHAFDAVSTETGVVPLDSEEEEIAIH